MGQLALLATLFAPFLGAIALLFVPNREPLLVRAVAATSAGTALLASLYVFMAYDPDQGGFQFITKWAWSEELGIGFSHRGGWNRGPVGLCLGHPAVRGIFISWHIKDRTKEFYIFLLILAAATIGVFMSLDLFFLYFFYEMSVLPMYVLLGVWGSHTKGYLSMTDSKAKSSVIRSGSSELRGEQQGIRRDEAHAVPLGGSGVRVDGHPADLPFLARPDVRHSGAAGSGRF